MAIVLWAVLATGTVFRPVHRKLIAQAARGSVLLLALVAAASLMPVDKLPRPRWQTTLALGLVSSVFDNIPLTKLALDQGGYDWGLLAFAVGFGGSILWFGSSAGVAIANQFPQVRSTAAWLRHGWHVPRCLLLVRPPRPVRRPRHAPLPRRLRRPRRSTQTVAAGIDVHHH